MESVSRKQLGERSAIYDWWHTIRTEGDNPLVLAMFIGIPAIGLACLWKLMKAKRYGKE